jgi:hypothetical protein
MTLGPSFASKAASVRESAAIRESEERTGQRVLLHAPPATDAHYESLHEQAIRDAPLALLSKLTSSGTAKVASIRPELLESLLQRK